MLHISNKLSFYLVSYYKLELFFASTEIIFEITGTKKDVQYSYPSDFLSNFRQNTTKNTTKPLSYLLNP